MPNLEQVPERDRLLVLAEHVAQLHASPDLAWLATRFTYLAERALGASLAILGIPDERGSYRAVPPSSPGPVLARQLWIRLDVANLPTNLSAAAVFAESEQRGSPRSMPLERVFGERAAVTGMDDVVVAPAVFEREQIGMCIFVADGSAFNERLAGILAAHVAVAVFRLRTLEEGRRLHSVDPVLWIPDQQFLLSSLRREVSRARRYERQLGLALLHVTDVEQIRDRYGKFFTDHLLRRVGSQIMAHVRDSDIVGALDGGFAVIHVETSPDGLAIAARRLTQAVALMVRQRFPELPPVGLAVATAAYPAHADSVEALIDAVRRQATTVATPSAPAA